MEKVTGKLDPKEGITAILKITVAENNPKDIEDYNEIIGTGFYVNDYAILVTAKKVFDTELDKNERFGIVKLTEDSDIYVAPFSEDNITYSENSDIAVIATKTPDRGDITPLQLSARKIPCNLDALTYEFSSSNINRNPDGKNVVDYTPYTYKGNVLSHYNDDKFYGEETPVFVTSFPTLQGSRGAPVIRGRDFSVVGMLVGNIEKNLIPAKEIVDKGEKIKTKYYLPTGIALEALVVIESLKDMGVEIDIFES